MESCRHYCDSMDGECNDGGAGEAYMFVSSAGELWKELEDQFGKGNKPKVFHIRRQISSIQQGTGSLAAYSNKLKKLWEQLNCLRPRRKCICNGCTCGGYADLIKLVQSNNLMEFLNGLNSSYENAVNNILMMYPEPPYNKAYSIIATLEEQKSLNTINETATEVSALAVKMMDQQKSNTIGSKSYNRKEEKKNKYCNFCKRTGHFEDDCFKKNGYPEWFKALKERREQVVINNVSGNKVEAKEVTQKAKSTDDIGDLIQELRKFMRGKSSNEEASTFSSASVNAAYFADFAGLPDKFWGEAMLCASYVINRVPNSILKWKTPYEVLTGKLPDYARLRVFGCLCFVTNINPHKGKFHKRARKCIFLGYPPDFKGYKVYDVDTADKDVLEAENDVDLEEDTCEDCAVIPEPPPDMDTVTVPAPNVDNTALRRSDRTKRQPTWMKGYVACSIPQSSSHTPHVFPYVTPSCFSNEYLQFMGNVSQRKKWTPVNIRETEISHLLFADDVLIFVRIDQKSIMAIKYVLDVFLQCSGLSINNDKSLIWFSPNTCQGDRDYTSRVLGFGEAPKSGKYLGFPLGLSRRVSDYKPIVDKVLDKVENWKAKFLSKAGKGDNWKPLGSIHKLISGPLAREEDKLTVNDVAEEVGFWNWDLLSFEIPTHIKSNVLSVACIKNLQENDIQAWKFTALGWEAPPSGWWILNTEVRVIHIHKEGNACADILAKQAVATHSNLMYFEEMPCCISSAFAANLVGVRFSRSVNLVAAS
ncbi:uncharacterized protein G2W53_004721 [Senna tora]|uniref:Retroviral polymerase SH3-like domain-containing protein n=1 Tax=Senna tora TaxID=362788 RepID=A0A834XBP0_9FABA|nr:uncharacterized protein G2W53_004721 [Senna tora]